MGFKKVGVSGVWVRCVGGVVVEDDERLLSLGEHVCQLELEKNANWKAKSRTHSELYNEHTHKELLTLFVLEFVCFFLSLCLCENSYFSPFFSVFVSCVVRYEIIASFS